MLSSVYLKRAVRAEGDLRSTMSSGLGLKSPWSSLDGRVSGVKALLPLVKIAPGILLRVGFFSPRILCAHSKIKGVELICCTSSSAFKVVVLVLETAYQVLPFRLELSSGDAKGRGFFLNSSVIRSQVEAFLATSDFS